MPTLYKRIQQLTYNCCIKFQQKAESHQHLHQVVLLTQTKHGMHYNTVIYIFETVQVICGKTATKAREKKLKISLPTPLSYCASTYTLRARLYIFKKKGLHFTSPEDTKLPACLEVT